MHKLEMPANYLTGTVVIIRMHAGHTLEQIRETTSQPLLYQVLILSFLNCGVV